MSAWPKQSEVDTFYGNPRGIGNSHVSNRWYVSNIVLVEVPFPLHMGDEPITHISIHKLCALSLKKILSNIKASYAYSHKGNFLQQMDADGVTEFDGSYNFRLKTGGRTLSMHSYGCAVDFDAAHNPFGHRGRFTSASPIVQAFANEGWTWGGNWHTPDGMHFQAASV